MIKTLFTEKLGVKYPIVAGTMMYISKPEFTAAASNAGGLGVLASAIYKNPDELRDAIKETKDLTDKPFAVNINLFPGLKPTDNKKHTDVVIEEGVKIIETSGHSAPTDLVGSFKEGGVTWIHKCVGVKYAIKVREMGADMVTVVGYENGGSTGKFEICTLVLVPTVVDAVDIPVIGGGGVSDGRGVAAILSLGATATIIGTRIMLTDECPIHDGLKKAFLEATELDTLMVGRPYGAAHRVWNNKAARNVAELETQDAAPNEIFSAMAGANSKKMYDEGDLDVGIISTGQGVGMIKEILPIKDLFDRMMEEAETSLKGPVA